MAAARFSPWDAGMSNPSERSSTHASAFFSVLAIRPKDDRALLARSAIEALDEQINSEQGGLARLMESVYRSEPLLAVAVIGVHEAALPTMGLASSPSDPKYAASAAVILTHVLAMGAKAFVLGYSAVSGGPAHEVPEVTILTPELINSAAHCLTQDSKLQERIGHILEDEPNLSSATNRWISATKSAMVSAGNRQIHELSLVLLCMKIVTSHYVLGRLKAAVHIDEQFTVAN